VRIIEERLVNSSEVEQLNYTSLFHQSIAPVLVSNAASAQQLLAEVEAYSELLNHPAWNKPFWTLSEIPSQEPRALTRESLSIRQDTSVRSLMSLLAHQINAIDPSIQYLGFFISEMGIPSEEEIGKLIDGITLDGADYSFFGHSEYGHLWYKTNEGKYLQLDQSLEIRAERKPTFLARYGEGSIFAMSNCLSGNLFDGPAALVKRTINTKGKAD
jgi:hypothetical protein